MDLTNLFDVYKSVILTIKNFIDSLNLTFMGHSVNTVAIITIVLLSLIVSLILYGDDE